MNKLLIFSLLVFCLLECAGREPFKAPPNSLPFVVHFESRYRGLCVGVLVSRMAVLTAAVCVTNPKNPTHDTRPINVVTGTAYRHIRRGIRVQVTKIILPKLPNVTGDRGYLMQKSAALLLLHRKVPDILAEIPLRAIDIDYMGEDKLTLRDECIMVGWHFFYKGDTIYPVHRFLLQRNLRVQFLNLVTKHMYCDTLAVKFEKVLDELGFTGFFSKSDLRCVRDPDRIAQPCHGMYGSPLICRTGRVVGMLLAPDAQWTNCTGYSSVVHALNTKFMAKFFQCVKGFFEPEFHINWDVLKSTGSYNAYSPAEDFIKNIYDGVVTDFDSTTDEEDANI